MHEHMHKYYKLPPQMQQIAGVIFSHFHKISLQTGWIFHGWGVENLKFPCTQRTHTIVFWHPAMENFIHAIFNPHFSICKDSCALEDACAHKDYAIRTSFCAGGELYDGTIIKQNLAAKSLQMLTRL